MTDKISELEKLIFSDENGKILIGGEEVRPEVLVALKGQAKFIKTSQLFEIINATIKNQAFELGVQQSKDWDNVLYAKALLYYCQVFNKIINRLDK